jgi:serine/threonine protein kinase
LSFCVPQVFKGSFRGHEVAVKTLHDAEELTEDQLEEFRHEAALMIHIPDHENVVKIFGIACDPDSQMGIVVEYVGLGSLKDRIDDPTFFMSQKQIVGIATDIAAGMQHIHAANVLHRDLSGSYTSPSSWVAFLFLC